jgi:hypothetical protein
VHSAAANSSGQHYKMPKPASWRQQILGTAQIKAQQHIY